MGAAPLLVFVITVRRSRTWDPELGRWTRGGVVTYFSFTILIPLIKNRLPISGFRVPPGRPRNDGAMCFGSRPKEVWVVRTGPDDDEGSGMFCKRRAPWDVDASTRIRSFHRVNCQTVAFFQYVIDFVD